VFIFKQAYWNETCDRFTVISMAMYYVEIKCQLDATDAAASCKPDT